MKLNHILSGLTFATLLTVWQGAPAQSLQLTGVSRQGSQGTINGKIDMAGKQLKSARTYVFNMADGGSFVTADVEPAVSGNVITAPVQCADGDYAYRLEVTFTDNTTAVSPCIDPERTYAFMWLSDYSWQSAAVDPESGACRPRYDHCAEDVCNRTRFNGLVYTKQASTHANGHMQWRFPDDHRFTRLVCKYGMEDDGGSYADAVYRFSTNGITVKEQRVYGRTNGSRGGAPWVYDLDLPMQGVTTLRWDAIGGANIWSDHCHLLMPRLYMDLRPAAEITWTTTVFPQSSDRMTLNAVSSSGAPVSYSIAEGAAMARIENGNELVVNRNAKGQITVKASCPATETFMQGSANMTFNVDFSIWSNFLGAQTLADGSKRAFFSVSSSIWNFSELVCEVFDNELTLNKVGEFDMLPYYAQTDGIERLLSVPMPEGSWNLCRLRYKIQDDDAASYTMYSDGVRDIAYASDMVYVLQRNGAETVKTDAPVSGCNNNRLRITNQEYSKGFSVQNDFNLDLGQLNFSRDFVRFRCEFGEQSQSPNSMSLGAGQYYMPLIVEEWPNWVRHINYSYDAVNPNQRMNIDFRIEPGHYVNFRADGSRTVIGREYCIGAARFYTADYAAKRQPQTLSWVESKNFKQFKPFSVALDAVSSAGAPVFYHIVSGGEFAAVENGELVFHTLPEQNCQVVVEAVQAGTHSYNAAAPLRCAFNVLRAIVVQADEVKQLESGDHVEEVVIYGNSKSVGQLTVRDGILKAKKLVLKYTFTPGEWNYLAFPSDLNLDRVSDFAARGYTLNAPEGQPSLTVRRYNTLMGASNTTGDAWVTLKRPLLEANRGYIIKIGTELGTDPVEITFDIDNVRLDMDNPIRPLNVALDLSGVVPGSTNRVYIQGENIKTNTLQVDVAYNPADHAEMPVNHAKALEQMRITTDAACTAMRLTLPTQDVARVGIFKAKGDKLMKAVKYISPNTISISDLPSGTYNIVVTYGPATTMRTIKVRRL